ncbi:pyruvate dehydrogenase (acetyl-transferring) E1 component subunit alpha [Acidianus brierleyi]|uniref:2-oxoacid oxidoreductase (ferredoxin) n=2 Tax=Acidianus brierleyi TaxID=41673 RepID=A0A2U9II15_9CREN|nr:pyruvate dehydrogenase (acetyl-transferring) E1 component subunit alpha [Acidianus brierleyi]
MMWRPEYTIKDLNYILRKNELDKDRLLSFYRKMYTIRYFEESIAKKYYEGKVPQFNMASGVIRGEMHLAVGQEAIAVGVEDNLKDDDVVVSTHRPHHHAIAKGVDLKKLAAEIFGKSTGLCKGKGGHMHLFDKSKRFSCSGIVGASFPQALGAAFAFNYTGTNNVAVAFAGEGAANHGTFAETLNIASAWNLPLIIVIEDNLYADSTPKSFVMSTTHHYQKALANNIQSFLINGNDVIEVYTVANYAIKKARSGFGPTVIEAVTYRLRGHFEGDSEEYRTKEEVELWRKIDPISFLEDRMMKLGYSNEELNKIRKDAENEVNEAIKFAENSPYPSEEDALRGVFA